MKIIIPLSLSLLVATVSSFEVRGADTAAPSPKITSLEVMIKSGPNQKEMRSALYLLVSRRHAEAPGATEGRVEILLYDKWGPNEPRVFGLRHAGEQLSKEDLGGMALVNSMNVADASELEIAELKIWGLDAAGKKWLLATYAPSGGHWLRYRPQAHELPVLPIATSAWVEVTASK